jgi:hypothetical protein
MDLFLRVRFFALLSAAIALAPQCIIFERHFHFLEDAAAVHNVVVIKTIRSIQDNHTFFTIEGHIHF